MKKFVSCCLLLALLLVVTGCGDSGGSKTTIDHSKTIEELIADFAYYMKNHDSAALAALYTDPAYWIYTEDGVKETIEITRQRLKAGFDNDFDYFRIQKLDITDKSIRLGSTYANVSLKLSIVIQIADYDSDLESGEYDPKDRDANESWSEWEFYEEIDWRLKLVGGSWYIHETTAYLEILDF